MEKGSKKLVKEVKKTVKQKKQKKSKIALYWESVNKDDWKIVDMRAVLR